MQTNTLPDKPSELILCALADLEKCEADPHYKINMGLWHRKTFRECHVCLAGSVMAQSLGVIETETVAPSSFPEAEIRNKLYALNRIRTGDLQAAGTSYPPMSVIKTCRCVPGYDADPRGFKTEIRNIAEAYAEIGS